MAVITVSQLNRYIASKVSGDANLKRFMIRGEISNFSAASSGHCYFSLKDAQSVVSAVMFRRMASMLKFRPENGMKVIVSAGLNVYETGGIYQLNVTDMQPDGVGALALAMEQRKKKLAAAGLFDVSSKRPLPPLPQTVGVITSGTGAALQDILNILRRRCPIVSVKVFPVPVQGADAPDAIARAVRFAGTQGCDVLILGRGGGSAEDLDAFNAECVAYAVYDCPVPLISAVGHETDFTITDLVADRRAPTPSAAAELAVPELSALHEKIHIAANTLRNTYLSVLNREAASLALVQQKLRQYRPDVRIRIQQEQLGRITERLGYAMQHILSDRAAQLHTVQEKLTALDPLLILQRGYAAVYQENGDILPSVKLTAPGDSVRIRLADGSIDAKVEVIHEL
jgi:exodeoxyribonuclease VII large subunit